MLRTEVLVQKESVMARGMQPTKLYIILSGKVGGSSRFHTWVLSLHWLCTAGVGHHPIL